MARDRISRSSSDCFKAHDAARCSALSRLRAFRAPDLTEFEISSNADKIWSSSVSSERKAEDRRDSSVSFGVPFPRSMESTLAFDEGWGRDSLSRPPSPPAHLLKRC